MLLRVLLFLGVFFLFHLLGILDPQPSVRSQFVVSADILQTMKQWFSTWAISPPVCDRAAQRGEKMAGAVGGWIWGDGAVIKYIDASMCLTCEDSVRPEFGRQNQPRGNSSTHNSYAPVH